MGIRAKLIASLSSVLMLLTVVLGVAFAVREQGKIVALKRDHLKHSAELAATLLRRPELPQSQQALDTWNSETAGGPTFELIWQSDHESGANDTTTSTSAATDVMSVSVPLRTLTSATTGQLVAAEPLPNAKSKLLGALADHLLLGTLLTAAAALGIALICHRLVLQPVQWLVRAADQMANGDGWEPIEPEGRRRDEIGVLADHLAQLSRRLATAVRTARHDAAHLVSIRVRREMEEPLRNLAVGLATLEATGDNDSDTNGEIHMMYEQVNTLRKMSLQLVTVQPLPRHESGRIETTESASAVRTEDKTESDR